MWAGIGPYPWRLVISSSSEARTEFEKKGVGVRSSIRLQSAAKSMKCLVNVLKVSWLLQAARVVPEHRSSCSLEASDSLSHLHLLPHFVLLLTEQISAGTFLSVASVPG